MSVKKIAIIGAGPGGLAALNEFIHTGKGGVSTLNGKYDQFPDDPAFDEIVLFERNSHVGGIWYQKTGTDPTFPKVEKYYSPQQVAPRLSIPEQVGTPSHPYIRNLDPSSLDLQWTRSSVYDNLFTNVPWDEMIFSTNADLGFEASKNDPKGFKPFASHREILDYIQKYAKANDLEKYIRFNTSVQKVVKKAGKWQVTVDQIDREKGEERWYTEEFDAVFVASGRGSIPFVPEVEGLKGFASRNPDVVLHAKAFRNTDDFKGKKVLVVGSGISALDISQYLIAVADRTIMSFDSADTVVPHQVYQWTHDILSDNSIPFDRYPKIKRYLDDDGVEFVDGKIERGFDKIILATGYHLYQPFLDFPGNKPVTTNTRPNGPLKRLQNLYLYSFTVGDPTLAYTSISNNPYFFPLGESIATMVSGVWSGHSKLPAVEVQQEWADKNLPDRKEQEALFKEDHFLQVVGEMFKLAPEGRTSVTDRIKKGENEETKEVMKELSYKFSKGELREEA